MAPATADRTTPPPSRQARLRALLWACGALLLLLLLLATIAAAFVAASSLVALHTGSAWLRGLAGLTFALGLPLALRALLRRRARARGRQLPRLGGWFFCGWNLALVAMLCGALGGSSGPALVAHGDWILGGADGWFPRRYRRLVRDTGNWLAQRVASSPSRGDR